MNKHTFNRRRGGAQFLKNKKNKKIQKYTNTHNKAAGASAIQLYVCLILFYFVGTRRTCSVIARVLDL
jgi:hypothetical protein